MSRKSSKAALFPRIPSQEELALLESEAKKPESKTAEWQVNPAVLSFVSVSALEAGRACRKAAGQSAHYATDALIARLERLHDWAERDEEDGQPAASAPETLDLEPMFERSFRFPYKG